MSDASSERTLERKILLEIADIDLRMEALRSERATLQRLLIATRRNTPGVSDATRKNSVDRLVTEDHILQLLKGAERGMSVSMIFRELRYKNPRLKETTFRSYLHRLQNRGEIEQARTRGYWQITTDARRTTT